MSESSLNRVDGTVKVTGAAMYSAEYQLESLVYGVLVTSTIAKGRIKNIDTTQAERASGVLSVVSHLNSPEVPGYRSASLTSIRVFYDDKIYFNGQPIGLVVADTLERAQYAASLVKVEYTSEQHQTNFLESLSHAGASDEYIRGNRNAFDSSEVKVVGTYLVPTEHHNPMEPHATIAFWDGDDKVTLYDKTQNIRSLKTTIARAFNLLEGNIKIKATFLGGAFGSALRVWPHVMAAVIAAKKVKRPVKLVLSRSLMFTSVGYRPYTWQKLKLGASREGKLNAIIHEAIGQTSSFENFTEGTVYCSRNLYECPNVITRYGLSKLDVSTPTWMRAPGEATGVFALECALDELAYALKIDPVQLRLINYADKDPESGSPWSSKSLRQCYEQGAERFGWHERNPEPRTMRLGHMQVGYGMASSIFSAARLPSSAKACLLADGLFQLQSATTDMGPGTATALRQIAASALGVAPEKIKCEIGDSSFPNAPYQGASITISSVGSAALEACQNLKKKIIQLAVSTPGSELFGAKPQDIIFKDDQLQLINDNSVSITFKDLLKQNNLPQIEVTLDSGPTPESRNYSMYSFGAYFVEVHVDPDTLEIRVKRVTSGFGVGKIINHKTARSQAIGGAVGGIGMALTEESVMDHRYGRYINGDLAGYHVPVNADIPDIDVFFIDEEDRYVNPLGSKGLGEITIVGMASAIANAVYHATGKRVRELPISPDKL